MRLDRLTAFLTAAGLATTSVAAAPPEHPDTRHPGSSHRSSTAQLSLAKAVRTGSQATARSKLAGGGGFVVAVLAAAAIIAGLIIVAESDEDTDSN